MELSLLGRFSEGLDDVGLCALLGLRGVYG